MEQKSPKSICAGLAWGFAALLAAPAWAGTGTSDQSQPPFVPPNDVTMAYVRAHYGQPSSRKTAVGQPPITRWDYHHFIVYFEYNRVIHSVIPGEPPPLYHRKLLILGQPGDSPRR